MTTTVEKLAQNLNDHEAKEMPTVVSDSAERLLQVSAEQMETLSDNELVGMMRSAASQSARLEAIQVRGAAILARRRPTRSEAAVELAAALYLTDNHADAFVAAAEALTSRWPQTLALMERGRLNLFRAMQVTDVTAWLSDEAARTADAKLAPRLPGKNHIQVRKSATYAAMKADPEGANLRARRRRESRTLRLTHRRSGTATLTVNDAPAEKAVSAYSRVDSIAKSLKTADEPRTLDQLRADVALDLLLSADSGDTPRHSKRPAAPSRTHVWGWRKSRAGWPGTTRSRQGRRESTSPDRAPV